ncbi:UDP-N-acetylmuramate dehydrogenase [Kosmotoga pacifica]|uniref:UDP-N-acetylenolpyruvoylglucosamine reductase n=1 Tax=Kosmotoga pacifica TaxID=1330330 RepID=A0A0G2Z921_9BACT|nr:UDP-N-acetylmuramate dehydrogenase [Kosmotoga pacifica]AKI98057.1 UDP-N-acetylenolpyruvoylglucosamine reductase [Kosmotoga pacifica]
MKEQLFKSLYLAGCDVRLGEKLSQYTTIRIGGPAKAVVFPQTVSAFIDSLNILKEAGESYKILGGGSNVVPPPEFNGIVVSTRFLTGYETVDNRVTAECGITMRRLLRILVAEELSGLEFLSGLPGSLGGALFMNAGAFGGEIGSFVEEVTVLDDNLNLKILRADEIEFSYRYSSLQKYVILKAVLRLRHAPKEKIRKEMERILRRRLEKQPLDLPSAGSTFKRPREDFYVGTTIDALGLKGLRIGGAEISTKHAGFIINRGNATQEDVKMLIEKIQGLVFSAYGVKLEPEVKLWKGGSYV